MSANAKPPPAGMAVEPANDSLPDAAAEPLSPAEVRRQPSAASGTWAVVGWAALIIGLLWIWSEPVFGPITDAEESVIYASLGFGLTMVAAGIGAGYGKRPFHAAFLIFGGAVMVLRPIAQIFLLAAAFSIMGHN
ncbi:hypothetical protein WKR88_20385 [Trinickia caryophylli]|uniref:Uncharacterized protein n=1 Tax=Trinickia caryophylli TaxID=28094 RepID=A0A1X7G8Y8_TRICW|nr:hypothetical protein [Trinickia caryophylli]TRX17610.1 hypothetical protein FNF07_04765 [Trinickia caryophylli]WQE11637.1 hypothetical protein U0034_18135 [Trinickia caryophylli]SMF65923.1 hypothetical protein SAMN06295900_11468 [Trinickia caryophylli]